MGLTPTLTWSASNATSYSIACGTTNPPAQAASGLTAASYAPGALAAGATYYWRVTATSSAGSTTGPVWSFTTAFGTTPPATTLPSPWKNQDIGNVALPGSATASNGVFTVKGAGDDIWNSADAFQYVNQPVTGNVEIVARVTSVQNTNQYAKAGVMLREALTANSAHVTLDVLPGGGVEFLARSAAGAATTYVAGTTQVAPAWVRLTRSGGTVTGAVSADGTTWRTVGTAAVTSASGYAGLAVTSHNSGATNTSTFDYIAVRALSVSGGGLLAGWTSQDVGSTVLAGSTTYTSATGTYTVTGAGADIWGTTDAFQYASQAVSGNVEIILQESPRCRTPTRTPRRASC